jgi:hypothetical protein
MKLRFHWMLPKGGEVAVGTARETAAYRTRSHERTSPARLPDMEGWTRFARVAEGAGIDSVLISCGPYEPDPLLTACAGTGDGDAPIHHGVPIRADAADHLRPAVQYPRPAHRRARRLEYGRRQFRGLADCFRERPSIS